ncbi:MAG TPA: M20/M25/M40 family metallo-hydrolase [Solirubrobacteraceae bacterium]|nr:M20/M25/M40 family metallo-hydrolase [Solirubrobacteraceae bacterium]
MEGLDAALGRLDATALARDVAALVQVPSVTGDERAALERLGELAEALGLHAELHEHDLEVLRAHPDHPGEEGPRTELLGLTVAVPGARDDGPRLALNGHVDVVPPGTAAWRHGPWSGAIEDGFVWGRGAVDMKGAVVAALHALGALGARAPHGEVVLLAVSSEEDGGLGTLAALERDSAFDACLIPEPTGFDVVCAQAGSIVFEGVVEGVSAHAAHRLEGVSAIDRYVPVHVALADHERAVNADVRHPLMRELELPYPLVVGKVGAGEWPSTVPDRLVFAGRAPVRVGESLDEARAAVEAVVAAAGDGAASVRWRGGQFAPGETPADDPFAVLVRDAVSAERGAPARVAGVPWGADMRLFCARGIPCVMVGPRGIELAHAVDERVRVEDLLSVARTILRVAWGFTSSPA